jgi:hypothetical protein
VFHAFAKHAFRALAIYAVILNIALGVAFALFLFKPATALPLYQRFIDSGTPSFINGLLVPSAGDPWFVVFVVFNLTWFAPALILFAVGLVYDGVRPELVKHGIVALGRDTATRGDDSFSWFGITNGAMLGIALLGGLAALVAYPLTSDEFQAYAHKKNLQSISVGAGAGVEGYRAFVRGLIGTNPAPSEHPASAPAGAPMSQKPLVAQTCRHTFDVLE